MSHRERRRFTHREYLQLEEQAESRSEYYQGDIFAMTGGSVEHNQLLRNLATALDSQLRAGPCQLFVADLRLYVEAHDLFTYPDLFIVCGDLPRMRGRTDTLTDAKVIVEVLSPSTEVYDRGEKFLFYQTLPGFSEYLLVSQEATTLEQRWRTKPGEWHTSVVDQPDGTLSLKSVEAQLSLTDVYRGVTIQ